MSEPLFDLVQDHRPDVLHPDHPGTGVRLAGQHRLQGLPGQMEVQDRGAERERRLPPAPPIRLRHRPGSVAASCSAASCLRRGGRRQPGLYVTDPFGLGDQVVGGCRVREDPDCAGPTLLHRPGITDRLQGTGDQLDRRIERCDVAGAGPDEDPLVAVLGLRVREHPHPDAASWASSAAFAGSAARIAAATMVFNRRHVNPPARSAIRASTAAAASTVSGRASWTIRRANHTSTHPSWTRRHSSGNRCRRSSPSPISAFAAPSVIAEHRTELGRCELRHLRRPVPTQPHQPLPTLPDRTRTSQHRMQIRPMHRQPQLLGLHPPLRLLRAGGLRESSIGIQPVQPGLLERRLEVRHRRSGRIVNGYQVIV